MFCFRTDLEQKQRDIPLPLAQAAPSHAKSGQILSPLSSLAPSVVSPGAFRELCNRRRSVARAWACGYIAATVLAPRLGSHLRRTPRSARPPPPHLHPRRPPQNQAAPRWVLPPRTHAPPLLHQARHRTWPLANATKCRLHHLYWTCPLPFQRQVASLYLQKTALPHSSSPPSPDGALAPSS